LLRNLDSPSPELEKTIRDWDDTQVNDAEVAATDSLYDQAVTAAQESDPNDGFKASLLLAEQGSVWAMMQVAWCYDVGNGVTSDLEQAEAWDRRAMERGSRRALLTYLRVLAWRRDWATYDTLLMKPEFNDWAPVLRRRATRALSRKNNRAMRAQARAWLERATLMGDMQAALILSVEMARGQFGLTEIPSGLKYLSDVGSVLQDLAEKEKLTRSQTRGGQTTTSV
jgi:TPR repeat protein